MAYNMYIGFISVHLLLDNIMIWMRFWEPRARILNHLSLGPSIYNVKTVSKWIWIYKWPLYDLFWQFFHHMCVYLSKNWGSVSHFECLSQVLVMIGSKVMTQNKNIFISFFLLFCTKTAICLFRVFCTFVFFVITFVPIKIQNWLAPKNDHLNLSFVKYKHVVGKKGQIWLKNGYLSAAISLELAELTQGLRFHLRP